MLKQLSIPVISILLTLFHTISYTMYWPEKQENDKYKYRLKKTIKERKHKKLESILKKNARKPNEKIIMRYPFGEERYPLEMATIRRNLPALFLLLKYKANPSLKDITYTAIDKENLDAICLFLANHPYKTSELEAYIERTESIYPVEKTPERDCIISFMLDTMKGKKKLQKINLELPEEIYKQETYTIKYLRIGKKFEQTIKELLPLQFSPEHAKYVKKERRIHCSIFSKLYAYRGSKSRMVNNNISKGSVKYSLEKLPAEVFNVCYKHRRFLPHLIVEIVPEYLYIIAKKIKNPNIVNKQNVTIAHLLLKALFETQDQEEKEKISKGLKRLLKNGANPCIRGNPYQLMYSDGKEIVRKESLWTMAISDQNAFDLLLEHADLTKRDPQTGETAIHQVMSLGMQYPKKYMPQLEKLLKKAKDSNGSLVINIDDLLGFTPLHRAVLYRNKKVISLLFKYKANRRQKNKFGQKPKKILRSLYRNNKIFKTEYNEIKKIFLANGAKNHKASHKKSKKRKKIII